MRRPRVLDSAALSLLLALSGCGAPDASPPAAVIAAAIPALDSLLALGEAVFMRGDIDSARTVWRAALTGARGRDVGVETSALTWLSVASYRQGDYPEARTLGEQALAGALRNGLQRQLPRTYNALALLAWNEGRLGDVDSLSRRALETARAAADTETEAKAENTLGLLYNETGRFPEAEAAFRRALELGRQLGVFRIEAGALSNLGMTAVWRGEPQAAVPPLQEALASYRAHDYPTGEQNTLGQLGTAYMALGEPARAFAALDSGLAIALKLGLKQEVASDLELMGDLWADLGSPGQALRHYLESRVIAGELGLSAEVGNTARKIAGVRAGLGQYQLARAAAEQALRLHQDGGEPFEELHDRVRLVELELASGRLAAARPHLDAARRLEPAIASGTARVAVALAEARLAEATDSPRAVLAALAGAEQALEQGSAAARAEAHALALRAWRDLDQPDSAAVAGRRAVRELERVRSGIGSPVLRSAFAAEQAGVYGDVVLALLAAGRTAEAFDIAEAARSRSLLEHIGVARSGAGGAVRDLAEGERLLRRIDELIARLRDLESIPPRERGSSDLAATGALGREIREARGQYEALLLRAGTEDPAAAALLGAHRASAAAVARVLQEDEALVEYLVTPARLVAFVITPRGIRTIETAIAGADLASRVRLARELLMDPAAPERSWPALEGLHALLIAPLVDAGALMGVRRLIVVPNGPLARLPFQALRAARDSAWLDAGLAVSTVPAAATLVALRTRAGRRAPLLPRRTRVLAPFPELLPATVREAIAVRRSTHSRPALTGSRATEAELRRALAGGAPVHVASHGALNPYNPMFSRIELARTAGRGPANNGRLELHEILGLRVRSPLVFLSGCETGLGSAWRTDFDRSDDHATLAQAFLFAGARAVIGTLWRVEDQGAAEFAARFYGQLRSHSPAEALAAAQREMRADPRFAAPYYWAAYVLTGDGS